MKHLNIKNNVIVRAATPLMLATILVVASVDAATMIGINQSVDAAAGTVGETAPAGTLAGVTLPDRKAPTVVSGDNIYIAWWTNNTEENGNEEVMFRASADGGQTFGNKTNLSNTPDADSWRVEIAAEAENVAVTWWETNQTSDTPVARISTDGGETFGPMLRLAANGTIASTEGEGGGEGE